MSGGQMQYQEEDAWALAGAGRPPGTLGLA